ncbi:DgyrCDS139 [Dimorphilus gyrociliatus]|nr:DgyrCDS139 [Dimorphilus gyrociliatus]
MLNIDGNETTISSTMSVFKMKDSTGNFVKFKDAVETSSKGISGNSCKIDVSRMKCRKTIKKGKKKIYRYRKKMKKTTYKVFKKENRSGEKLHEQSLLADEVINLTEKDNRISRQTTAAKFKLTKDADQSKENMDIKKLFDDNPCLIRAENYYYNAIKHFFMENKYNLSKDTEDKMIANTLQHLRDKLQDTFTMNSIPLKNALQVYKNLEIPLKSYLYGKDQDFLIYFKENSTMVKKRCNNIEYLENIHYYLPLFDKPNEMDNDSLQSFIDKNFENGTATVKDKAEINVLFNISIILPINESLFSFFFQEIDYAYLSKNIMKNYLEYLKKERKYGKKLTSFNNDTTQYTHSIPLKTAPMTLGTTVNEEKAIIYPRLKSISKPETRKLSSNLTLTIDLHQLPNDLEIAGNRKLLSQRISQTNKEVANLNEPPTPSTGYIIDAYKLNKITNPLNCSTQKKKDIKSLREKYSNFAKKPLNISFKDFIRNPMTVNSRKDNIKLNIVNKQTKELSHKFPSINKSRFKNGDRFPIYTRNLTAKFDLYPTYSSSAKRTSRIKNEFEENPYFDLTIQKIKVFSKNSITNRKKPNLKSLKLRNLRINEISSDIGQFQRALKLQTMNKVGGTIFVRSSPDSFDSKDNIPRLPNSSVANSTESLKLWDNTTPANSLQPNRQTTTPTHEVGVKDKDEQINRIDSLLSDFSLKNSWKSDRKDSGGTTMDIDSDSVFSIDSKELRKAVVEIRDWILGKNTIQNIYKICKSLLKPALTIIISNCSENERKHQFLQINKLLSSLKSYMTNTSINSRNSLSIKRSDGTVIKTDILQESLTIEDIDALKEYITSSGLSKDIRTSIEGIQDWAEGYLSTNMLSQILRNRDKNELNKIIDSFSHNTDNQKVKDLTTLIKYLSNIDSHQNIREKEVNLKDNFTAQLTKSISRNKQQKTENTQSFLNSIMSVHSPIKDEDKFRRNKLNYYRISSCLMKSKHRRFLQRIFSKYNQSANPIIQSNYPQSLTFQKYHKCSLIVKNVKEMDIGRHITCLIEKLISI